MTSYKGGEAQATLDQAAVLREAERIISEARASRAGTRVVITLMFVDIVDSTASIVELGDERWAQVLTAYQAAVLADVERGGGTLVDFAGDGAFAAFDIASKALDCAAYIRASVKRLGLAVRIGVHTGECRRIGQLIAGLAVHVAARISALANDGEVLISSPVRDMAGAEHRWMFVDRGLRQPRSIPFALRLFAVTSA